MNPPDILAALIQLHCVCLRMDAERQAERPTEAEYQAAMQRAAAAIVENTGG